MPIEIQHDPARGRFSHIDPATKLLCERDYQLQARVMVITHTGVPPALGGRGIAAELVQAALAYAQAEGLQVRPLCSYVATYMRCHPDTLNLLEPQT